LNQIKNNQLGQKSSYKKMLRDGKEDKMERLEIILTERTERALIEAENTKIIDTFRAESSV